MAELPGLLGRSRLADVPAEGIYERCDNGDYLVARAKQLVRSQFTQAIEEHWSKRGLRASRKPRQDRLDGPTPVQKANAAVA